MKRLFAMVVHAQPKSKGGGGGSTVVGTARTQSGQTSPIRRVRAQRGGNNGANTGGRTRGRG